MECRQTLLETPDKTGSIIIKIKLSTIQIFRIAYLFPELNNTALITEFHTPLFTNSPEGRQLVVCLIDFPKIFHCLWAKFAKDRVHKNTPERIELRRASTVNHDRATGPLAYYHRSTEQKKMS